ncbi:MAG: hypothetical protein ABI780_01420 [Ardenticatenales bacterium]
MVRTPFRHSLAPPPPRLAATVAAAAAAAVLCASLALASLPGHPTPAARAQANAPDLYLPDLRSAGPTTASLPAGRIMPVRRRFGPSRRLAPASISDFGYSAIDLANLSAVALSIKLDLSQRQRNPHSVSRALPVGGTTSFKMHEESVISDGVWHGVARPGAGPAGAIVRSGWVLSGTSTSAYEGLIPATKLLVPLFIRGADGVYSDYTIMNADTTLEDNAVTFDVFAPDTGELIAEWEDHLEKGDVTNLDAIEIGNAVSDLPANRADGSWVGALRIEAAAPVAILIYQNEALEGGVSAMGARTFGSATAAQYLPLVRRNYLGNSVIAVQNRDGKKANVTITYHGAHDSPKLADQSVTQSFTIGPNGMHYVDLGTGTIGDVPAPAIDRGSGTNTGFYGSAVVTADTPVLAAVMETTGQPKRTRTNAAYNAFNSGDFGQNFLVPAVRSHPGQRITAFFVQNPGTATANVTAEIRFAGGRKTTLGASVPAGEMRSMMVTEAADEVPAIITSDQPVAVLVYETPFGTVAAYQDVDVFDTVAYAAPRNGSAAVPPTTVPGTTTVPATSTPTPSRTPNGQTPTSGTPVRTTTVPVPDATPPIPSTTTPPAKARVFLPFVLRAYSIRAR